MVVSVAATGLAGSRERITQVASLEASVDQDRYGIRLQLSTPQLLRQKVWSPSVFFTTPEGGEEEVVRAFFSMKEDVDGFLSEFTFKTLGPLTPYLDFQTSSAFFSLPSGQRERERDWVI